MANSMNENVMACRHHFEATFQHKGSRMDKGQLGAHFGSENKMLTYPIESKLGFAQHMAQTANSLLRYERKYLLTTRVLPGDLSHERGPSRRSSTTLLLPR